ncbi:MAG: protein kinase [Gemmatimonadaceae bacterium]|jgi:serine/threonine-protein kinase|nr:protein kinase [Gemmatimonadaceae bacterium]
MTALVQRLQEQLAGRYVLGAEMGRGATAAVYRARDTRLGRDVAIKLFDRSATALFGVDRFLREIALEARLNHPLIVPLLDTGEVDGTPYFIMPCIEGESLRARLQRQRELPLDEAVHITRDVATALAYAHAQGVIHRDIKPENILLTGGTAVVADFGIARILTDAAGSRLTATGVALGTVPYMSPEQAMADAVLDARSDIYSLGCVLFECLVGEPPHMATAMRTILARRASEPPPSPRLYRATIPSDLDRVVRKALATTPADRYATARDFAVALTAVQTVEVGTRAVTPAMPMAAIDRESGAVPVEYVSGEGRVTGGGRIATDGRLASDGYVTGDPRVLSSGGVTLASSGAIDRLHTGAFVPPLRSTRWVVGVVAGAALMVLAWALVGRPSASTRATAAGTPTIAVLPFTDRSATGEQDGFAAGMTEELIRVLSRVPRLRVAGRTSSFALRDTRDDARTIGARLGVGLLLTGSVRRGGDSLRITAELVDTRDGLQRWNGEYAVRVRDVFAVQDTIAQAIVNELSLEIGPRGTRIAPTANVAAYQLYLRGYMAWLQRTPASLQEAAEYYRQATAADPGFVRAWAGLADCYIAIARNFFGAPAEYLPKARAAAERAIALDADNAEARTALASLAYYVDHDWERAEREFRRAIALDSSYADAAYFHALFLATVQRGDAALAEARRALALEPLSGPANMGPGMVLWLVHRPQEAIPALRAATQATPRFYFPYIWLGLTLARTGDSTAAITAADEAVRLAPGNHLIELMRAQVLAMSGRLREARAEGARIAARTTGGRVPQFELARLHALLGDTTAALDALDRARAAAETQSSQLLTPGFESLRAHPRFIAHLRALRLDPPPR